MYLRLKIIHLPLRFITTRSVQYNMITTEGPGANVIVCAISGDLFIHFLLLLLEPIPAALDMRTVAGLIPKDTF